MDCRTGLLCCLGFLVSLSGCDRQVRTASAEKMGDEVIKKPETYVAFADYRAAAAFSPETPPEAQQIYREEARSGYLKAIEMNPNHVPAYLALARLQQAVNDLPAALATYQRALQVTAKDAVIWYELGMCQARQKQFAESVVSLQKACELRPESKSYQETMGYTQARAGNWSESLTTLTAVVGDARAHLCLGRMLHHMNQPEQARQYVTAALSRDPNLPGGRELLASLSGSPTPDAPQIVEYSPTQPAPTLANQAPVAPSQVASSPTIRITPTVVPNLPTAMPNLPAAQPIETTSAPHVVRLPPRPVITTPASAR